jgi:energy-coupling factor transport system ATP-binding protein
MPRRRSPSARALRPGELAEAVVLADVSLALTVLGQVIPLGGALLIAAVVPLAIVGARHRLRAVVTGAIAAAAVGFLVIGTPAVTAMLACGTLGALVGAGDRRGWSSRKTIAIGLATIWPVVALIADALLFVFSDLRDLTLRNVRNGWDGTFNILHAMEQAIRSIAEYPVVLVGVAVFITFDIARTIGEAMRADTARESRNIIGRMIASIFGLAASIGLVLALGGSRDPGNAAVDWMIDFWWISIPLLLLLGLWFASWLSVRLSTPALQRVRGAFGAAFAEPTVADDDRSPEPVPVHARDVRYRYPNAAQDALHGVAVDLAPGELVALVGANGSGKSTLARIVAGRLSPASGTLDRPGSAGLGRLSGTAIVAQRPEAQVLGVRVRDDIVWGLTDPGAVDTDTLLARVGLAEFAERETSTLSGGELQRLAVAAALAREPVLLVSDESTAMVDGEGRAALVALLRGLTNDGLAVLHVTHLPPEAAAADRIVTLNAGRVVANGPLEAVVPNAVIDYPRSWSPVLKLEHVGHVYSRNTPWAHRAPTDVNLEIRDGDAVLVVGHNGSGKSTLAWALAGLLVPSEGVALLDGEPVGDAVGKVGLSFQHARMQVLRPTVLDDVRTAAAVETPEARAALTAVGLDPDVIGPRRTDELSGGQLRRVVLAGVLATRPRALVLDEPFAGLDAGGRAELEALLVRLRRERNVALVIVSHDLDLHHGLLDRIVELRDGRIVRDERVAAAERGPQ